MKYPFRSLVLAACLAFASVAAADDHYAPLQQADTGNWFDASQSGTGFDILPYPGYGAFVTFYGGQIAGTPAWFAAQLEWRGPSTRGALYKTASMWAPSNTVQAGPVAVGEVLLAVDGSTTCGHLTADIEFADVSLGPSLHFALTPLIQPQASLCEASCLQVDFGPYPEPCLAGGQ